MASIASVCSRCLSLFTELISVLGDARERYHDQMPLSSVEAQVGRFRVLVGTYVKGITIIKEIISGKTGVIFWSAVYLSRSGLKGDLQSLYKPKIVT